MKVIISVGGRFHAFHLAEQLEKYNCLSRFITTIFDRTIFHRWKEKINRKRVISLPLPHYIGEIIRRAPISHILTCQRLLKEEYSKYNIEMKPINRHLIEKQLREY